MADKKGGKEKEKKQISKQNSIVKEAEMLITEYVDNLQKQEYKVKNENKK